MLKSPFHPGQYLRKLLQEHHIAQTTLAKHINVQVGVINQICCEKRGISPAMAVKLGKALNTSPDFWLNLQTSYEFGKQKNEPKIQPLIKVA